MATIAISNLHPTGSILFSDEETFLDNMSDEQAGLAYGGAFMLLIATDYQFTRTANSLICDKFHPCPTPPFRL